MGYFPGSPWTDAASYGQGLGSTLGQALLAMPQQRYELAAQQQAQRARMQQEALQLALQQKAQSDAHMLGTSELHLKQQKAQHAQDYHEQELKLLQQKADNEMKGTWKFGQDKNGLPWRMNTLTGAHEWLPMPTGGAAPQERPQDIASAQRQAQIEAAKMVGGFSQLAAQDGLQKSQPQVYNTATNMLGVLAPYLMHSLTNRLGQANSQFQSGMPSNMAQPQQTNAPAIPAIGGMPATNPASGFRTFNPATGQLE